MSRPPAEPARPSRTVVISPAPTANGDLHLGHIAGPFLAADVHTRYARSQGRDVALGTGFQDTSTFVVTTALRRGVRPEELVANSAAQIQSTLLAMGIGVDGYTGDDDRFTKWVVDFLGRLHAAGRLELRSVRFPYSERTGQFLVDGFASGGCPECLADGCAGLCESCGHLVAAGDLIDVKSTLDPDDPVTLREVDVLVFPVERYREQLREHFEAHVNGMRPHMAQAMARMLSQPLPDFPVTYPIQWGIPVPFAEVAGQVVNPNAEAMAWSMHCSTLAAQQRGGALTGEDELWLAGSGSEVVYFLGFDNIYPFAVAGPAMLLAFGGHYDLPTRYLTNEFYELDHQKFSTSRGHVVSGRDLVTEVPRDLIRFALAATSPEHQRTSFSRDALTRISETRLVGPWNRIADRVDTYVGSTFPVSARSRRAAARVSSRFAESYELAGFSLNRAAEAISDHLARLDRWQPTDAEAGDFCFEVAHLLRSAAPILIDLAADVLDTAEAATITPVALPRLTVEVGR
ncbi:class I tRNA ligase family protein [Actinokineospora cianjurensis]|uniref:Methionyl-tRNA synthetase n=1 Tax=Actinokineospora cianjurensis TaxID=585224 RepID=A0A421AV66_9PSEU|nr:class I tRNA ligase family protein [Actinokineospora cianjurensis]RLK53898.1 methionyl-tRNA synthetase [Actinokineospora cianjurensis]